ncbi:hypothetical protein COU00_01635, partial [Candidatus Falkowbacteria bacterium CG10_big_fil_rev_8_21_14_0_10_43_11]
MKQEMIGDVPNSILGMYADLSHKLQAGAITPEELGLFLKKRNPFAVNSEKLLDQWHQFYLDIFDVGATFSGIRIPNFRESFPWLIVPIPEVPTNAVWQGYKNQGIPTWSYYGDDLEAVITQNDRNTKKGAYVIWVRDRVEADEELKNLSANQLKDKNIPVITCDERLRLGLYYWWKTGG